MSKDPKDQTKEEKSNEPGSVESAGGGFSLEELDGLILNKDPEFLKSLEEISKQGTAGDLGIDVIDLDQVLVQEDAKSLRSRFRQLRKIIKNKFIIFFTGVRTTAIHFFRSGLPYALNFSKAKLQDYLTAISQKRREFSYLDSKIKLKFFTIIFLCGLTIAYIWFALTNELIAKKTDLFIHSLGEMAEYTYEYDPAQDVELFYDSTRATQNILQLKKIVVNVRKSSSSGPNPMAAFEFYVEGNSPEAIIEIKFREYEVRDLFQRIIEDMSFDQLENPEGKKMLVDKLRREINRILSRGRVKQVYINTALLKP